MIKKNRTFPILPKNILAANCVCVGGVCVRDRQKEGETEKDIAFLNPNKCIK